MADNEHAQVRVAEPPDDVYDAFAFPDAQRGRRLIHDDGPRPPGRRARDADPLALSTGELPNFRRRIHVRDSSTLRMTY